MEFSKGPVPSVHILRLVNKYSCILQALFKLLFLHHIELCWVVYYTVSLKVGTQFPIPSGSFRPKPVDSLSLKFYLNSSYVIYTLILV